MKWAIVLLTAYSALACQPLLRIYETDDGNDILRQFLFVVNEPDLSSKNLTNENTFTCTEGVWMAYRNENYTGAEDERYVLSGPQDGVFNCTPKGSRVIRSLKVVGSPGDYSASAVVTYPENNNYGDDFTYLEDTSVTNGTFQSLILVGHHSLEIFTDEEFGGASYCVKPGIGEISTEAEYNARNNWNGTEMYTNLRNLEAIFDTPEFKSFKFGCDFAQ